MEPQQFIDSWAGSRGIPALLTGVHERAEDTPQEPTYYQYAATPNDYTDTRFGIGSLTKSMTAIGILALDSRGALSLDDPVASHIDWEQKTDAPVTIRHLLSHTSGRPSDFSHTRFLRQDAGAESGPYDIETFDDLLASANDYPAQLCREPGSAHFYYNTGYALLGAIIEAVTGAPYEQFIREQILNPLNMDSRFISEDTSPTPPFYRTTDSGLVPVTPDAPRVLNPAGGLFCTCEELLRYGRMLRDRGEYDDEQVVPAHIIESLLQTAATVEGETDLSYTGRPVGVGTGDTEYALGLERKTIDGTEITSHHGSLGYAEAQLTIAGDAVIASVANRVTADGGLQNLNLCLYDVLQGRDIQEPYHTTTTRLNKLTGVYEAPQFGYTVTVERRRGHLAYDADYGAQGILLPAGRDGNTHYFTEPYADGQTQRHEFVETDDETQLFLERHAFLQRSQ